MVTREALVRHVLCLRLNFVANCTAASRVPAPSATVDLILLLSPCTGKSGLRELTGRRSELNSVI